MKVKNIQAKSILNPSKITDYCINPYTGCSHNCIYCYATYMKRYSGHKEPWGEFVDVKINAPKVLEKQLIKAKPGSIYMSSVCDCYQPVEKKFEITRKILKLLLRRQFPLSIQTKSDLVLRDLDLIKQFRNIEVGFTITTLNKQWAKKLEPGASPPAARIKALKKLHDNNIKTYVFIGPILPYITDCKKNHQ